MKTAILIVSKIKKGDNSKKVIDLKNEIVKYVGTRMLDSGVDEDIPGLMINQTLATDEKKKLSEMCTDDEHLVFIESTDEAANDTSPGYIDCELKD